MKKTKYINIIKCLRSNSRESLTSIAKKTNSPVSTASDRLKATEQRYVIKHTSLIDFEKLGYKLRSHILVKSNNDRMNKFIERNSNINSAFGIEGKYDLFLDCIFKHDIEFGQFIQELEMMPIECKEIYFINDELKREAFLN